MKSLRRLAFSVLLVGVVALASMQPLTAESTLSDDLSDLGNGLQTTGKAALNVVSGALNAAGDVIGKTARSLTAKACVGSWRFVNGKCTTTLICREDNTAELQQVRGKNVTAWRGTYSSTANAITFRVIEKATKGTFFSSRDPLDETWHITYRAASGELRLTSDDIPDDANGYDFSNPTLLVQQVED